MIHRPIAVACILGLAACATAPAPRAVAAPVATPRAPVPEAPTAVAPTAVAPAAVAPAPVAVTAPPPEATGFVIEARSDLPPGDPSTARPFAAQLEAVAGTIRGAVAECLRPLGAPAHRSLRLMVDEEGRFLSRPPQSFAMPPRVAACVEGTLRAVTVTPPPPRAVPYDLVVDVSAE